MKSFDYPVEICETVIKDLETFLGNVTESVVCGVNKNYLSFLVKAGKEKKWDSFLTGTYSVATNLRESDMPLFSILESIKAFGDEKRIEKGDFKISLSIQCITIRDISIELYVKFRDLPFLGTECLRNETIPSIPESYYTGPHTLSTRRPFYKNRLLAYKYAPNENLLLKMDKVIKKLEEKEVVKDKGLTRPRIETSTTLYNREGSPHHLKYTSYLYDVTIKDIEELFSPLFDTACEFLKGTPRDVVIVQERGNTGRCVTLYPDGKYIRPDEYKELKEEE